MAFINGWGRGTWGQLGWGEGAVPIEITGVEATGSVSGVGVNGAAVATVASVTASLGTVSVSINADANVDTTGLGLTSALGTIASVTGKANITPTGQEGTSALGTVTTGAEANVTISETLVATLGNVSVDIDGEANVIITSGVAATGSVGSVTTRSSNIVNISITEIQINSALGTLSIDAEANISLTGLSATGELSNVNVWGLIDEDQTPNWQEVAA